MSKYSAGTANYRFAEMTTGAAIIRASDGASVWFPPALVPDIRAQVEHCFAISDAWPGENVQLFDRMCKQYF